VFSTLDVSSSALVVVVVQSLLYYTLLHSLKHHSNIFKMPVSDRLARAKQLRGRRSGGGSGGGPASLQSGADEESSIEMSGASTMACVFLLLSLGASFAASYIMIHSPDCMGTTALVGGSAAAAALTVPAPAPGNIRTPAAVATTAAVVTTPGAPTRPGFPDKCTIAQLAAVKKQLPPDDCFESPYTQMCSFSRGTNRGCKDNIWVREIYGTMKVDKFHAVFVNNACTRSAEMMEVMKIGSHDGAKFNSDKFLGKTAPSCLKEVTLGSPQPAYGVCITNDQAKIDDVVAGKKAAGLNPEIQEVKAKLGAATSSSIKTMDTVLEEIGMKGKPIHYMVLRDDDYDLLRGATTALDQVRYLEFEYHYTGSWDMGALGDVIKRRLADKNFVCYWKGVDQNLWRITDCWQTHYAQKWWSNIACVSATHKDAKPLLAKMEEVFEATLKKEQKYGGK
jgi:hypothetical protein